METLTNISIDEYKCKLCNKKRKELFLRAKNGEIITERILHCDVINNETLNTDYIRASCIQTIVILAIGFISFAVTRRRIPYWS